MMNAASIAERAHRAAVLGLLLAICATWPLTAGAQRGEMPGTHIDPISFRGPDPAKRFKDIKMEQKLEAQVPLHLKFKDDKGQDVTLQQYFGEKPVVLALVYYRCAMLCNQVLNGMVAGFDGSDNTLNIGQDYEVVTVSIDPRETPELAKAKKEAYLKQYHREGGAEGWHFLTGDEEAIETLATAVGYRYYYDADTEQFAHDSGIIIVTPEGKISSYYLGIEYIPKKLQFAIMDAGNNRIGSLVDQVVLLCYGYDPSQGAYGFLIFRAVQLGGALVVAAILLFWLVMAVNGRKRKRLDEAAAAGALDAGAVDQTGGNYRTT